MYKCAAIMMYIFYNLCGLILDYTVKPCVLLGSSKNTSNVQRNLNTYKEINYHYNKCNNTFTGFSTAWHSHSVAVLLGIVSTSLMLNP